MGDDAGTPTVLVTRPEREGLRWVDALQASGLAARALPLIAIGPAPDPQAVARCRDALHTFAAVMFVSPNAVSGFLPPPGGWAQPGPRAWAPGPGTREALQAAGVPTERIDAPDAQAPQFDSEALWQRVKDQLAPGQRVLIVRGADARGRPSGRDWLAQRLQAAGIEVRMVAAYSRQVPVWSPARQALARAAGRAWWLFSSSEAIANLGALLPGRDWSPARALCTHPRIAQAARNAGFGQVYDVRPTPQAVAAFLQSQA